MSQAKRWASLAAAFALGASALGVAALAVGPTVAGGSSPTWVVEEAHVVVNDGRSVSHTVKCPTGYVPVGGGAHFGVNEFPNVSVGTGYSVLESDINVGHTGWTTVVSNADSSASSFTVDAVCLKP